MKMLKILLCVLLMALPVFAEEAEDRQTATSLHYVSHELDTRQNKLSAGSNKALTYTNAAGNVLQRDVKANLNGGTTDTSLPQVNAVNAGLDSKQDDISVINDHTAVTYTGQTGTIGHKGIYQDTGTYAEQTDALIDAKTFNAALKTGLDSEFVCGGTKPGTDTCWLWEIHNTYNAAVQPYVSATGTVVQNGTPTPENPIYPTFYRQGDMILRKVGDYADSYDATTHKITRRVGVKTLNGTETWSRTDIRAALEFSDSALGGVWAPYCTHYQAYSGIVTINDMPDNSCKINSGTRITLIKDTTHNTSLDEWKQFLAAQYAAGTPVTVYYPLATPTEEDWSATTYNENVYIPQNQ